MSEKKEFPNFLLEVKDQIAIFSVNKPAVRNAISEEDWGVIADFMAYADSCDDIRVIIITGGGDKAFVAGADISKFGAVYTAADAFKTRNSLIACDRIENSMKPVIAAINGYAFGGGVELAIACDLRIVSENAQMGLPETNLGIIPSWGGTQRLARLIGVSRAKEMILGGRTLKGQEIVDFGLGMKCVPQDKIMEEALALATTLKYKAPLAMGLAKKLIKHSVNNELEAGLLLETLGINILLQSEDKNEGTAAFREKRKPEFKGK